MIVERLLRAAAVVIALLGVVDPALTLPWRERPIVGVVVVRPSAREGFDVAQGSESLSPAAAQTLRARVVSALAREFDARDGETAPTDAAAVVLVGDGRSPVGLSLPAGTVVSAVVPAPTASAVRIVRVDAPRRTHSGGRVPIVVQLDARGVAGRSSTIVVRGDGLELARRTHAWQDGVERVTLTLDALPLHAGLTRFTVAVLDDASVHDTAAGDTAARDTAARDTAARDTSARDTSAAARTGHADMTNTANASRAAEASSADASSAADASNAANASRAADASNASDAANATDDSRAAGASRAKADTTALSVGDHTSTVVASADVAVDVQDRPLRVLFVNARPSWATQFIRRALEDDSRFAVVSATRVSRGVTATTAGAPATLAAIDPDAFHAIVVGAPELLTKPEVDLLRTFARVRGGVVVIAPDRRPEGPVLDLLPARDFTERLLSEPAALLPATARALATPADARGGHNATTRDRNGDAANGEPPSRTIGATTDGADDRRVDGRLWATELAVPRALLPGADALLTIARIDGEAASTATARAATAPAASSPSASSRNDGESASTATARAATAPSSPSVRSRNDGEAASTTTARATATAAGSPSAVSPTATSSSSSAVVMQSPLGDGVIILSGALDAWRYRDRADAAFDRFWRETIAARAQAVPDPVEVTLEPAIARPGDRIDVAVRVRTTSSAASEVITRATRGDHAEATLRSGTIRATLAASGRGEAPLTVVRLWPDARPGAYHGSLNAPSKDGVYAVSVRLDGQTQTIGQTGTIGQAETIGRAALWVEDDVHVARPAWAGLQAFVDARHGTLVTADQLDRLASSLREAVQARPADTRHARHPLRSAWWIVPFAGCIGGEWLLRRRRGAR